MPFVEQYMEPSEAQALARLIKVAQSDTGQSRLVANFLLSWWNAQDCGAFAPNDLWGLDIALVQDVVRVFGFIGRSSVYPDTLGLEEEFKGLVKQWRPHLSPPSVTENLPTTDGHIYRARVVSYGNAPGYRDINVHLAITDDERQERHLEIAIDPDDSIALMQHVKHVNQVAWRSGHPIDVREHETRPRWVDQP